MTGNVTDAARALAGDGIVIGEGSSRIAYLINGVVYKVDNGMDLIPFAQDDEWNNYMRYQSQTLDDSLVRIPAMSRYDFGDQIVLSMEYIDGYPTGECYCTNDEECGQDCMSQDIHDICTEEYEVWDLGYGNVIVKDGIHYIVDFAC
jgi:hypothetical protein